MSFPEQYRELADETELDAFAVSKLFKVSDDSGCLQYALRTLLQSSTQTNKFNEILKARNTLNRWLQLNKSEQIT